MHSRSYNNPHPFSLIAFFCFQIYGVKGPSWLAIVPSFDLIRGTSVDYMHCVLLGVCRHLLKLWFKSKNHNGMWYIGTKIDLVDGRLLLIKPPDEIQRTPRSLDSTRKYWKGMSTVIIHMHVHHCDVTF